MSTSRPSSKLSHPSSASTPSGDSFLRNSGAAHPQRTLADVREQVAQSIAARALRKALSVDGTRVAAILTLSKHDDERFLRAVAAHLKRSFMLRTDYLFAVATTRSAPQASNAAAVIICGSVPRMVRRAAMLAGSKFLNRVVEVYNEGSRWIGIVDDLGATPYDEAALWDILKKSAQRLVDPALPPPGSRSADLMLSDARARIERVNPSRACEELSEPAPFMPVILVDIRSERQRSKYGGISGSLCVERGALEFLFDPRSPQRLDVATRYDIRIILFDQEGDASSLAAASLQDIGLLNATDIIGGFRAWVKEGLPMAVRPHTLTAWEDEEDEES